MKSFTITTKIRSPHLTEEQLFKVFKNFVSENFQNWKLEVSGKKETLRDEFSVQERDKEVKNGQNNSNN